MTRPERTLLAPGLEIPRVVTGLWQVADIERRAGQDIDPAQGAHWLADYAAAGFDAFDMADHYGSAEVIAGTLLQQPQGRGVRAFTKWCPPPGPMTPEVVRAGVQRSRDRLRVERIDLLQFHWWTFEHPGYLDAMLELTKLRDEGLIGHLGLTNVDTDHLQLLLGEGVPIACNQVCFSLLDRRAAKRMSTLCQQRGVKLLAYGTLGGGFLSERWFGRDAPPEVADWSKMKYRRFIEAIGGWGSLQAVLRACDTIARKHGVSIANVATRWVLEQPPVAAVIVGARLGESEHRADNLKLFSFALDADDHALLDAAFGATHRIPGDCGDEYRKPPFLTASGDLSHHLDALPPLWPAQAMPERPDRQRVDSGSVWEPIAGYSRAVRVGDRIVVSGTTATHGSGRLVGAGDAASQTVYTLDKIAASLKSLGGSIDDVIRTRIYLRHIDDWRAVSEVHGRVFGHVRPANTLLQVAGLIGDGYRVEIEAEAVVAGGSVRIRSSSADC